MEPDRPEPDVAVLLPKDVTPTGISAIDAVTEGVAHWWGKNTVGLDAKLVLPLAEAYLRPSARRNYQALLSSSAAVGALLGQYYWRSTRTVLKVLSQ